MKLYIAAVAWISCLILIAHLIAPGTYSGTQHTISQLAAQDYSYAWVMQAGFIGFGGLILAGAAYRLLRQGKSKWSHAFIALYGLTILLSGIFSTSPFIQGVPFSETEANIHSVTATIAGIAISAAMLSFAFTEIDPWRKAVHALALGLTITLSLAFTIFPAVAGILQRILYLVGFAWLVFLDMPGGPSPDVRKHLNRFKTFTSKFE